jgi:Tol biopolymer transport system component
MRRLETLAVVGTALTMLGLALAPMASAQDYFGRNPVQWERLKFKVLKTDHFDVYYYDEEGAGAEQAGRLAERWYARLSKVLDFQLKERQPIILYASSAQFQQTNTLGGAPGEGTGGVTEAYKRRVVLPFGMSLDETNHVLGHELVHAFQYAITGQSRSSNGMPAALNMPLWFIEGMAEYLSLGPVDTNTAMWMRDAAVADKLPKIRDLNSSRYFPYRYGQALWAYLAGRFGDEICGRALRRVGPRSNDAETILKMILEVDEKTLSQQWHAAIKAAIEPSAATRQDPKTYGPAIVTRKGNGGNYNVGPALSPDGTRLAFLSERDAFSFELFVANAKTGQIEHRLSHAATDPNVESLGFIDSAGAFDRTGKRFVLAETAKGRPRLVVVDAESGKELQVIPFPKLGEIVSPSFSPDGKSIVFSGLIAGFSDLYVYDLVAHRLRQLTEDAYADLQPAWSPDGKTIAFVTDRFSTKLDTLAPGDYRLAALDLTTGDVRPLPSLAHAKNIDPQWAPSGRALFFVSDASGTSNVYRLDLDSGSAVQLTDLKSGASGITPLSPAISVAAGADRLAYSVYDKGHYEIYGIDAASTLAGAPVPLDGPDHAGVIPGARAQGKVLTELADAQTGLAETGSFRNDEYKPRLTLDYVGQPYLSGGIASGGQSAFAGGISMQFSDMLGEHGLSTMIQAQSIQGFTDLGALVSYVNRTHRFNWGVQGGQVPYIAQSVATGITSDASGNAVYAESLLNERELDRSIAALGIYPFDPATRIELQAGFRNISFAANVRTDYYDPVSGAYLNTQTTDIPTASALNLGYGTVALVRDTSVFGATSPVMGTRFRIEASPVVGSINYTAALADFRGYLHPTRTLTLAARVLHYGRYGSGADDSRLYPLFIGDRGFVRGYSADSFTASECGVQTNGTCPVFDQLVGSRLLMGNVELRAPLVGLFSRKNLYGPLPIEVGAFFDTGVAWDSQTTPALFGGTRDLVKSVGLVGRANVLGFLVVEVDYAKPLDRPGVGMQWQVNLLSGF